MRDDPPRSTVAGFLTTILTVLWRLIDVSLTVVGMAGTGSDIDQWDKWLTAFQASALNSNYDYFQWFFLFVGISILVWGFWQQPSSEEERNVSIEELCWLLRYQSKWGVLSHPLETPTRDDALIEIRQRAGLGELRIIGRRCVMGRENALSWQEVVVEVSDVLEDISSRFPNYWSQMTLTGAVNQSRRLQRSETGNVRPGNLLDNQLPLYIDLQCSWANVASTWQSASKLDRLVKGNIVR